MKVRPEIQALRAVAVLLVLVYHLWPDAVPGGFVGVDVFFVISGFLITAHLLREVDREGRVSLPRFWARRARRLLPAALLTLLTCAVLTLVLVPSLYWEQFLGEIGASTAYVQNWRLAADAVDYLAASNRDSPVQHFWSLSAEEQFYLVWPLLIAGMALLTRRRGRRPQTIAIAAALGVVTAGSLAISVLQTASDPAAAYFVTPTRAWEFGLGGLLAVLGVSRRGPVVLRGALCWAGLAAILAAGLLYSGGTPFPGWAALLPVLGALAVIQAGLPERRWTPAALLRLRPLQATGDISYALYLWHWPLLVFAPFALSASPTATRVGVLVASFALAWATTRLVEDPVRFSPRLTARRPRATFALALAATALVAAVVGAGSLRVDDEIEESRLASARLLGDHPRCFGAASRDPERPCANPRLRDAVVPAPIEAVEEGNAPCGDIRREGVVSVCEFGVPARGARRTIALVGDSHAAHWRAALDVVARQRGWHGLSITRTSCPFSQAEKRIPEPGRSRCAEWNDELPRWFARHPDVDMVVVSQNTGGAVVAPPGWSTLRAAEVGYRRAWRSLPASVRDVVVLRDTPKARFTTLDCVDRALAEDRPADSACAVPRRAALEPDPAVLAARRPGSDRERVVDLTAVLCGRWRCHPVVGGALAYRDEHHLTAVFARSAGPLLGRRIVRAVGEAAQGDVQRR